MHLYGLIIGITLVIGISYFSSHNMALPKSKENLFVLGVIIFGLIGARVYHVIDQWSFYSQNPILIPQTWNGGLGVFGGIFGATLFIFVFSKIYKLKIIRLLNCVTPILPLCQAIGRFGNYVNHENPTWWSEAIMNFLLFILIHKYPQNPTAKYLIGYGLIRFVTEFYRSDTWVYQNIKIGQIISLVFIFIGLCLFQKNTPPLSAKP